MQVLTNRSSWRNQGCFSQDLQQGVVKQKVIFHYQFSKIKKYVFEIYILKTIYYNWNKSIYCQIFFAWHNLQEATLWCILLEVSCCHLPGCNPRKSLTDALVTAACCIFFLIYLLWTGLKYLMALCCYAQIGTRARQNSLYIALLNTPDCTYACIDLYICLGLTCVIALK